ncbi:hypothetical protein [Novosphingobium rosa]|uniref:hypothetical protein n=1 Tax=Novosphingobium rosa TaxID=76978 RepID=UPI00082AAB99|nr:hypothetical protein [Novosphingobium rosa]
MTDTATTGAANAEPTVETTVGEPSGTPLSVEVTFVYKDVPFTRSVPACLDASGAYDETATAARIALHANTMRYRVDNGLLTKPEPQPTPEAETGEDAAAAEPEAKT